MFDRAKAAPETKETPSTEQKLHNPDYLQAAAQGLAAGLLCPILTLPCDKLQTNMEAFPGLKLSVRTLPAFLKGVYKLYPFTAGTNTVRYTISYVVGDYISHQLHNHGVDVRSSKSYAYLIAGALDGIISGFPNAFKQRYFLHNQGLNWQTAVSKNMRYQSLLSACYIVPRNSLNWFLYNDLLEKLEKNTHVNDDINPVTRTTKKFVLGGLAGLLATIGTHPIDTMKTRHVAKTTDTPINVIREGIKEHGVKVVTKVLYRGASVSFFRMPLALAANTAAVSVANYLLEQERKKNKMKV